MVVGFQAQLELNMARFEYLMDRRPLLLSSVMLRQNPHDVEEWLKRASLVAGKPKRMVKTFAEAVTTVQPDKVPREVEPFVSPIFLNIILKHCL